ncbi:hypothetical protein [Polyangium sp. 6x1]|uniref:peptidase MA family metallohydrolase n=1 Tax=Polyangium sp. 6x1 TaxID=3042689 RepID=UPI002482EB7D|nr:hypothetical protein [Polyangium sp. 6x1]MDI1451144.1 hypothetical protein [Polyangium sp. 6x1]
MRAWSRAFVLASVAAWLVPADAFAAPPRPHDAPAVADPRADVPARPTGYLELQEAGLTFAYHPSAHERVRAAIPAVLRARKAMSELLGRDVLGAVEIRVAAVPEEVRSLGPMEDVPGYAPALAFSKQRLVVTSLGSHRSLEPTDLGVALPHALAHVALDEALDHKPAPLWLHEGFAAHVAGEASAIRAQALLLGTLQRRLHGIAALEAGLPADAPETSLAYAQAADLARFLTDKPRRSAFVGALDRARSGEPFEQALAAAHEVPLAQIELAWREDLARRYGFLPVFLAGIGIWALGALVLFARRVFERRRAGTQAPASRKEPRALTTEPQSRPPSRPRPAPAPLIIERLDDIEGEREDIGKTFPPEAEVPKVEHDGDWYTLH